MVPEGFIEDVTPKLERKLDDYRLAHSYSVARTARDLARIYGVDTDDAYAAGLVHDWDKCSSADELFEHARKHHIEIPKDHETAVSVLHAQTGAALLHDEYPELDKRIVSAVSKHTLGDMEMSDLDEIVYIADLIEPLRTKSSLEELRLKVGTLPLDELFLECYARSLRVLVDRHRHIEPHSIDIWNSTVAKVTVTKSSSSDRRRSL